MFGQFARSSRINLAEWHSKMGEMTATPKVALPSTPDKLLPESAFTSQIVEVVVGNGAATETFHVHKDVLTFYSGYFKAALNGSFIESQHMKVVLKSESPATFRDVVVWMYTRRLPEAASTKPAGGAWFMWPKLWIFGDTHFIPLLQNEVINKWHQSVILLWINPIHKLQLIYENTDANAKLRHWAVDIIANTTTAGAVMKEKTLKDWPLEALVDLIDRVWNETWKKQGKGDLKKWELCKYHVHEDDVNCENKGSTK